MVNEHVGRQLGGTRENLVAAMQLAFDGIRASRYRDGIRLLLVGFLFMILTGILLSRRATDQPWRASSFSLFMPSLPITFAAGQNPVKELCSRFAPTKTVSQMNPGWTFHQSSNDSNTMKPAKAVTPRSIDIFCSSVAAEFAAYRRA
jgi:hypothetical protein